MEQTDEIYQGYINEIDSLERQKEQNQETMKYIEQTYEVLFYERDKAFHIMENLTSQWGNSSDTYQLQESFSHMAKYTQDSYMREKEMLENEYKKILKKKEDCEADYREEIRRFEELEAN